jgi:hypothetical protein
MSRRYRNSLLIAATAVALLGADSAHAVDSWRRVASGGLGNPARSNASAMAIHDRSLWVATADLTGDGERPRLFRAALTADTRWSESTPPWAATSRGAITDLESFGGELWLATSFGEVWRHRRGVWTNATPRWKGAAPVLALGTWQVTTGVETLCAARGAVEVHCALETDRIETLPRPPLASTSAIGGADLLGFRDQLVLAVSGTTARSRSCELLTFGEEWASITADCFGDPERPWAGRMAALGEHVYLGTGGHSTNAVYRIARGGGYEAVTPRFLVDLRVPRYPAAAVAGDMLFVGLHDGSVTTAGMASVVRTANGRNWTTSNEPGFGSEDNFVTTVLAGDATVLYAATLNSRGGFEVWRRDFRLYETLRTNQPIFREWDAFGRRLAVCWQVGITVPGCPGRELLSPRFERLQLGFEVARHPADDAKVVLAVRQRFAVAGKELVAALDLAAQADKLATVDPLKARAAYAAAAQRLDRALAASRAGWQAAGDAGKGA